MSIWKLALLTTLALLAATACGPDDTGRGPASIQPQPNDVEVGRAHTYVARLQPINAELLRGSPAGFVRVSIEGGSLFVEVTAVGLPPGRILFQQLRGFSGGSPARCPGVEVDLSYDHVIDAAETESVAGVTLVPFHGDPLSMELDGEGYPSADSQGAYRYEVSVPVGALEDAFEQRLGSADLALENRVFVIYGVPEGPMVPATGAPLEARIPVACGRLDRVAQGSTGA